MKPYTWSPDQTLEEQKNGAYWERNMLALLLAVVINNFNDREKTPICGWYKHEGDGFHGWSRVISIGKGEITFHVPDDFDLGKLPEIKPNWNGHTTEEKWLHVMDLCKCGLFGKGNIESLIPIARNENGPKATDPTATAQ